MGYVNVIVDVDIDDFYDALGRSEKQELAKWLSDDGFKPEEKLLKPDDSDTKFDASCKKLVGRAHMLTTDEEEIINKIAEKIAI